MRGRAPPPHPLRRARRLGLLAAGAVTLAAATGGGDPLAGLHRPRAGAGARPRAPLRRRAHRDRPQPPDVGRASRPATTRRCGCWSSPAASMRIADGRRDDGARPHRRGPRRAPSRACSASPSIPTSRRTGGSTCTGPTAPATRASPSSAPARDGTVDPSPCGGCSPSTSPRRTTTAASSPSAPTAGSTSGSATAAARSTPRATAQDPRLAASARSSPPRSTAAAALADRPHRPAQPVALLVRPRARRAVDRRRRPGRGRGDRPRPARARRAAQEPRLERVRGHSPARGPRPRPRAASSSGRSPPTRTTPTAARSPAASSTAARGLPRSLGRYVYGDFCSGALWSLRPTPGQRRRRRPPRARHRPAAHPHRRRRRRRAAVRLRRRRALPRGAAPRRDALGADARSPGPSSHTRTWSPGCQAGKPSRRTRSARAVVELEVQRAGRGRRTSARARPRPRRRRARRGSRRRPTPAG